MKPATRPMILWVDDDLYFVKSLVDRLSDHGYEVRTADGPAQALEVLQRHGASIRLAILDIAMPHGDVFSSLESMGGFSTGLALARRIRTDSPQTAILAFSVTADHEIIEWFRTHTLGFLAKPAKFRELLERIEEALGTAVKPARRQLRSFIVHGHDEVALLSLKNYLQNTLHLPQPVVLREQSSRGRTIIEKFEDFASSVDVVFVLLTPDDMASGRETSPTLRARQNVVFELGYFLGRLERESGKVLLLYKGDVEFPSDLSGVVYIDIRHGVEAAGEAIRRELLAWLPVT